jgi:LemA protein
LRRRTIKTYAQFDEQAKRRHELIPNLVEIAKAYMMPERALLEALIAARNHAVGANAEAAADPGDPAAVRQMAAAESMLAGAQDLMFAQSAAYPDLKTDPNFAQRAEELAAIESRMVFTRQAYQDAALHYNASLEQFPGSVIANMFGFTRAPLL